MAHKPGPPVWEIAIILIAIILILFVFVLWWFFGYRYVFEEHAETVLNTVASTSTTLLTI
ncbi:MAG: hypothetical protein V1703_02515 [Candidatus Altiarchaeota archaeon]